MPRNQLMNTKFHTIKPLQWSDPDSDGAISATTPLGNYEISLQRESPGFTCVSLSRGWSLWEVRDVETQQAAKQKCQEHFEGLLSPFLAPALVEPPAGPTAYIGLTLTGADERTRIADLAQLSWKGVEIGFLFRLSSRLASQRQPERDLRFPSWEWIMEAAGAVQHAALHLCGQGAWGLLLDGLIDVHKFQRLQVNGEPSPTVVTRLCERYPNHTIITQHDKEHRLTWERLNDVQAPNHAVLVDSSGGQGKLPVSWSSPETKKLVGFAGGLGPHNLRQELPKIMSLARPGCWIDMESKIRIANRFSMCLAENVYSQFITLKGARQHS